MVGTCFKFVNFSGVSNFEGPTLQLSRMLCSQRRNALSLMVARRTSQYLWSLSLGSFISTLTKILRLALKDPYHPSNTPIYQTSTFVQPSSSEFGPYDYTRQSLNFFVFFVRKHFVFVFPIVFLWIVRLGESHAYSLGETCCNDGTSKARHEMASKVSNSRRTVEPLTFCKLL